MDISIQLHLIRIHYQCIGAIEILASAGLDPLAQPTNAKPAALDYNPAAPTAIPPYEYGREY